LLGSEANVKLCYLFIYLFVYYGNDKYNMFSTNKASLYDSASVPCPDLGKAHPFF